VTYLALPLHVQAAVFATGQWLRNEKGAKFHGVTVDNRLLKLNARGMLWYVIK